MTDSVRMAVEGSSVGKGPRPRWLDNASDIRFIDYSAEGDDTLLCLEAPCLGEAAHELYEQRELWPTKPAPEDTAVDLFRTVVDEVKAANPESPWYDTRLLKRLTGLSNVFSDRLRSVWLPARRNGHPAPSALDEQVIQNAAKLSDRTPPPQQVRVVGLLDMIRHSTRSFGLKMADCSEIYGVLDSPDQVESLRRLFGKKVLVLGKAVYRPSGKLLRLDGQAVESGEGQPPLWSKVPPPMSQKPPRLRERLSERGKRGVPAFFGTWPGDETDEELAVMLRDLRG